MKRKPAKDTDAESAAWWPKWRKTIKAELQKDSALRDAVVARLGRSGAPGGWLSIARGGLFVAQANGTLSGYALSR